MEIVGPTALGVATLRRELFAHTRLREDHREALGEPQGGTFRGKDTRCHSPSVIGRTADCGAALSQ